jgi:hypothetical protein
MQWWHLALAWTTAHWGVLAVVIPVAGAIVAGIFNHYLAVARDNRTRRLTRVEVRGRVSTELAARLLVHCRDLGSVIGDPTPNLRACRSGNEALHARCESADVVEALGKKYLALIAALDEERRALNSLERNVPAGDGREQFRWAVAVSEAAYRAIGSYLPFVHDFGEGKQARMLHREAGRALKSTKKLRHA